MAARVIAHPLLWLVAVLVVFFSDEVLGGRIFSPADLVLLWPPWRNVAPPGFQHPANLLRSDEALIGLPRRLDTARDILAHGLPLWQSHTLVGGPVTLSLHQLGAFLYPPTWAFLILSPGTANTILHLSVPLLGGVSMYFLLGRVTQRRLARFVGAVTWSLNGFSIVWLSAFQFSVVVAVFPLLMWLGILVLDGRRGWATFGYGALLASTFFTGYAPGNIVLCGLLGLGLAAFLVSSPTRSWQGLARIGAATLLGLGLASFAILAQVSELTTVAGSQFRGTIVPLPLKDLQTFLFPNIFGSPIANDWNQSADFANYCEWVAYSGIVILIPATAGALAALPRFWRQAPVLLSAGVIGAWSILMAYSIGPALLVNRLPILREVRPARWQIGIVFAIVLLGVYGLDQMVEHRSSKRLRIAAVGLVTLAAAAVMLRHLPELTGHDQFITSDLLLRMGLVLAAGLVVLTWPVERHRLVQGGLAVLIVIDLVSFGRSFNPAIPAQEFYPSTPGIRYLAQHAAGTRVLAYSNTGGMVPGDVLNVYGIDSLTGYDHLRHGDLVTLLGHNIASSQRQAWAQVGYLFVGGPSLNLDDRIFDRLNVRYAYEVDASPDLPAHHWGHWRVVYKGRDGTIFENQEALPSPFLVSASGAAGAPGREQGPGELVWSEPYDPGFVVRVDGRQAQPVKYDGYFLAVHLWPGVHHVELTYQPRSLLLGGLLSLGFLVLLVAFGVWLGSGRLRASQPMK